jgi:GDPmannose 4,6-dehydratase/GDP-4-dehydro-6-deoxy-D-mannose reductase
MSKALITGIAGSGGSYLADYILEHHPEVEVHGISRWHTSGQALPQNLKHLVGRVRVHECDLMDFSSVFRVLNDIRPDSIFHLAAHANVRASFTTPLSVMENNVMGTANLLEAVRLAKLDPRVQICSTSEVYGQVDPSMVPITEDCPIRPSSPYAVSKVAQDLLGFSYFTSYKMKIVRTRMFAYLNPRRSDLFATAFAMQVARIEKGLQKELLHGNLNSVRTFIDVRDAMESYWIANEKCTPGEAYNIGGRTTKTIGEFLEILKSKAKVPFATREDPALLRPSDVTLQIPDTSKFEKATGWKPKYSFEDSVESLLAHCRANVQ